MLVCLDVRHTASRRMIGGIMRFVAMHSEWEVQLAEAHPSDCTLLDFLDGSVDALIIDGSYRNVSAKDFAAICPRIVVYVNVPPFRDSRKIVATLRSDERAIALAAVEHFLCKRLSNFAFVAPPKPTWWSEARKRFFRAALKDRGFRLHVFTPTNNASLQMRKAELAHWLRALPKPCGIWAAYDELAKRVLDVCHQHGIDLPEQVQVLGVDNELYICEHSSPSLSSIAPNFEAGGWEAARFIASAANGKQKRMSRIAKLTFGVTGVIERLSTMDINGSARRVAEACEFIRKHATAGIGIPEVAAAVRVSRRLLEQNFHDATGRTILDFIQDARLAQVMKLLRETRTPIGDISRFCGFRSPSHLMTLFKRRYGQTMTEYRLK